MNLEEIKQRVEGATVVNWKAKGTLVVSMSGLMSIEVGDSEDAKFIAHAREDMTDLIAEVERLQDLVESYEDAFWDVIEASDLNFKDFLPKELLEGE